MEFLLSAPAPVSKTSSPNKSNKLRFSKAYCKLFLPVPKTVTPAKDFKIFELDGSISMISARVKPSNVPWNLLSFVTRVESWNQL